MASTDRIRAALGERYFIDRELGSGGMATVYLARDLKSERDVAIKVIREELRAAIGAERFQAEVNITGQLDHPNILRLIDSGDAAGLLYYVMPFVPGESLRGRITREGRLPLDEALTIARELASALEHAHALGILHRDIKPENVLLENGSPILTDFGIALSMRASGMRITDAGMSLGTPEYMSPEQAAGERVLDARSDVYALGVLLYEMLAGKPPISGRTAHATVAKLMTDRPPLVSTIRSGVPEYVDQAIDAALAKAPVERLQSARDFADALTPPSERRTGAAPTPVRRLARSEKSTRMALAGALLVAAAGAYALWSLLPR